VPSKKVKNLSFTPRLRGDAAGWAGERQPTLIEFELESRSFLLHGHDVRGTDLIVCWKHNWEDCPLEVIELSKELEKWKDRVIG
jgi:hypothetical protein